MHGYWQYYDDPPMCPPSTNVSESEARLAALGCTAEEVETLTESGYLALEDSDVLIDRYYGGELLRIDERTRYALDNTTLHNLLSAQGSKGRRFLVPTVHSPSELRTIVQELEAQVGYRLVFRGQVKHYGLERKLPNSAMCHPELGETSLLPSVWRSVFRQHPTCTGHFIPWTLLEWSSLLYQSFDLRCG